ncbi:hypothetical protein Tb09.244.1950 [Trypanosoma brucei brucei TREU927]|uniref:Uncharacterized protein n=1 Tax=Trypanosoma brucei brucei (strain 927/4 GUTat10.1) TaxID=185431 RepID=Q38CR2_TRYB2|nr:hypothetical protein Tb09.244.1950 [Trypanosoma brucei brucei TREU927]EAN77408.1 hypothetical protein Tb09.244.1950 [Trypanosoma brucei brucei TREU927]
MFVRHFKEVSSEVLVYKEHDVGGRSGRKEKGEGSSQLNKKRDLETVHSFTSASYTANAGKGKDTNGSCGAAYRPIQEITAASPQFLKLLNQIKQFPSPKAPAHKERTRLQQQMTTIHHTILHFTIRKKCSTAFTMLQYYQTKNDIANMLT